MKPNWTTPDSPDDEYIRPAEAASILTVDPRTLVRMADRGDIEVLRLPSGHRRYRRGDVLAIIAGRKVVA